MEDFVRIFKSPEGDIYHITISKDTGILSENAVNSLKDVTLVGIDLRRLEGKHATGYNVLAAIEQTVADYLLQHENVIICYYCDFINPIPLTTKNTMPPQEYRSRLFDKMFQRYTRQKGISDVRLSVVEINGVNEKYYFHVIYRECHSMLATLIGSDLKEGLSK